MRLAPLILALSGCATWAPSPETVVAYRDACRGAFAFGIKQPYSGDGSHFHMQCMPTSAPAGYRE
jgi:hypothetical protein